MRHINEIINRQVNSWIVEQKAIDRAQIGRDDFGVSFLTPRKPIVTISRQHGCRGQEFCRLLAHALGYGVFDRNMIDAMARDRGVRREIIESLDERRRSELELWVQSLLYQRTFDHDDYIKALGKVIKAASMQGGVVILGRGANYLVADSVAYRIRLVAPDDVRIRNLMQIQGLNEKQARNQLFKFDRERAYFIKKYFHKHIDDSRDYDLIINLGTNTLDAAVKISMSALRSHGWRMELTGGNKRKDARVMV